MRLTTILTFSPSEASLHYPRNNTFSVPPHPREFLLVNPQARQASEANPATLIAYPKIIFNPLHWGSRNFKFYLCYFAVSASGKSKPRRNEKQSKKLRRADTAYKSSAID